MSAAEALARTPGRPRSVDADRAILDATIRSLAEGGFARTTMTGIARDAGVSPATLYRRWSTLTEVVVAALADHRSTMRYPDTGAFESDLRELIQIVVGRLRTTPEAALVRALMDQARHDPELAESVRRDVIAPARDAIATIFRRGMRRGEVRADVDVDLAVDLVMSPLYLRGLGSGRPLDRRTANRLTELVLRAVR